MHVTQMLDQRADVILITGSKCRDQWIGVAAHVGRVTIVFVFVFVFVFLPREGRHML